MSTCLSLVATSSPSGEKSRLVPVVRPSSRATTQFAMSHKECEAAESASAFTYGPSSVTAMRRACSRSSYQETWLPNSGSTTTWAPSAAAASTKRRAVARLASTSVVTPYCTAATRVRPSAEETWEFCLHGLRG